MVFQVCFVHSHFTHFFSFAKMICVKTKSCRTLMIEDKSYLLQTTKGKWSIPIKKTGCDDEIVWAVEISTPCQSKNFQTMKITNTKCLHIRRRNTYWWRSSSQWSWKIIKNISINLIKLRMNFFHSLTKTSLIFVSLFLHWRNTMLRWRMSMQISYM
jgi:hypothetical protein